MPPKNVWEIFSNETPDVAQAWMKMAEAVNIDGVLDQKTVFLLRISIYSTTRDPIALRHFVREAFKAGSYAIFFSKSWFFLTFTSQLRMLAFIPKISGY